MTPCLAISFLTAISFMTLKLFCGFIFLSAKRDLNTLRFALYNLVSVFDPEIKVPKSINAVLVVSSSFFGGVVKSLL